MFSGLLNQPTQSITTPPPPPAKAGPGSLIIQDTFTPTIMGGGDIFNPPTFISPHGYDVVGSARQEGFQGQVVPRDRSAALSLPSAEAPITKRLGTEDLTKEEALGAITSKIRLDASSFLDEQSAFLENETKQGVKNSAANLSLGKSKASTSAEHYTDAIESLYGPQGEAGMLIAEAGGVGPKTFDNYAKAFGIDADKIKNKDESISGPERQKLQQAIVDHVSGTYDSDPGIKKSSARWDKAVSGFEAGNNSVVIAAGNEGDVAEQFASGNNGRKIKAPADFEKNLLENEAVTSVGATQKSGTSQEGRAEWSSVSGGVDVYANGTASEGVEGTSFAAPRVAATMAQLHKDNPKMTSSQIENLMRNSLTKNLNTGGGQIQVLDHSKTHKYLSESGPSPQTPTGGRGSDSIGRR